MPVSAWISPTTKPSGCADSSERTIRNRGSAPSAANMSAYFATSTVFISIFLQVQNHCVKQTADPRTERPVARQSRSFLVGKTRQRWVFGREGACGSQSGHVRDSGFVQLETIRRRIGELTGVDERPHQSGARMRLRPQQEVPDLVRNRPPQDDAKAAVLCRR